MLDKLVDLAFQIRYRVERAATDRLIGDQCKPAFDLVQPRAIRRREVQMKPWALGKPCAHPGVLVSSIVVADQMYIEVLWNVRLDVPQKAQKLLMPMLRLTLREHTAVRNIQRREQGGGAMTDIIVRDALDIPQAHRQHGLRAFERLCLAFLIHAQHQGVIRWVQIQADDITDFFNEERIIREFEALRAMRLQ